MKPVPGRPPPPKVLPGDASPPHPNELLQREGEWIEDTGEITGCVDEGIKPSPAWARHCKPCPEVGNMAGSPARSGVSLTRLSVGTAGCSLPVIKCAVKYVLETEYKGKGV